METILKELNAVLGVTGAFVCYEDGKVAAQVTPHYTQEQVHQAARLAHQMVRTLEAAGIRLTEIDLAFAQNYVLCRNVRGNALVIVTARNVNLPLLRVNANLAAKKLGEIIHPKEPVPARHRKEPATSPLVTPAGASFGELETEWQRLMREANQARITLRVIGELATWLCCPDTRHLLAAPEERRIDMTALVSQREMIRRLYATLGYQTPPSADETMITPRLYFHHPKRRIASQVHLDTFSMYHSLDLIPFLTRADAPLPDTVLVLLRLQHVETTPRLLRELSALLLQHDLTAREEPDKIQLPIITRLCADDWGWYRTVTMNLQRVMAFALQTFTNDDKTLIVERAARLLEAIDQAPKSLRWQARARLGDNVRWYELPATPGSEQPPLEIRYGD